MAHDTTPWTPITRIGDGVDCAWCEEPIPVGDTAMMNTTAVDFFCAVCVSKVYVAMNSHLTHGRRGRHPREVTP